MKKKSVLIYGWFGHENLGDELILKSIIDSVRKIDDNIEINVMGSKPKNIEKYHESINTVSTNVDLNLMSIVRTFKYNPLKVIKNLFFNEYLIIGSGGALSDWNPNSTVTLFFMINLFKKVLKRPVIMLGVGAGPIIRIESKKKFREILCQVDYICLRDKDSYELLKSIGLKNIYLTNDVVYDLKENEIFKGKKVLNNSKDVAIVIAPLLLSTEQKKQNYKDQMVKYILDLKNKNINCKLIPFQYNYDIDFLKDIRKEVDIDIYEDGLENMWLLLNELKNYDLIIGMRFHSVVLAILLNIPVLPIIYHHKVNSCVKEFSLEKVAQSIGDGQNWIESDIDSEKMLNDTLYLLRNSREESNRLKDILTKHIKNENISILSEFINIGE